MKSILVTGMLASGKSIALRVLQDLGYYCIDNLPPSLIPEFIELAKKSQLKIDKVALVIDGRSEAFFNLLSDAVGYLKKETDCEILFIDASDEVLIQRYKLMRRKHLMAYGERVEETIQRERKMLIPLRNESDVVIDTSQMKERELKEKLIGIFSPSNHKRKMIVNVVSFGFKYGILKDADLVFDVRFLPNPYYIETLKYKIGLQSEVQEYVMNFEESREFLKKLYALIEFLLPYYEREGKMQLVIGVGCSGGRHRSVTFAEYLGAQLGKSDYPLMIEHRDIEKDVY